MNQVECILYTPAADATNTAAAAIAAAAEPYFLTITLWSQQQAPRAQASVERAVRQRGADPLSARLRILPAPATLVHLAAACEEAGGVLGAAALCVMPHGVRPRAGWDHDVRCAAAQGEVHSAAASGTCSRSAMFHRVARLATVPWVESVPFARPDVAPSVPALLPGCGAIFGATRRVAALLSSLRHKVGSKDVSAPLPELILALAGAAADCGVPVLCTTAPVIQYIRNIRTLLPQRDCVPRTALDMDMHSRTMSKRVASGLTVQASIREQMAKLGRLF